ncbi:peptidoglycan DD-metalloendopeptidase family protein [Psittacicella hinzii]|nr:peptidoglycan DD-metalloendopeptidase family protein [Psittacicella hinzii]
MATALVALLTSCTAPSNNAPIYNIDGSASSASSVNTSSSSVNTSTASNANINPTFSITPAEDDSSANTSYSSTSVSTSSVQAKAPVSAPTTQVSSENLASCELTQPFRIPRGADNKPIYSQIVKGSYKAKNYTVQQGDTLFLLGYLSGTSAEAVAKANGLDKSSILTPGTVLVVNPNSCQGSTSHTPAAATTTPVAPAPVTSAQTTATQTANQVSIQVATQANTAKEEAAKVADKASTEASNVANKTVNPVPTPVNTATETASQAASTAGTVAAQTTNRDNVVTQQKDKVVNVQGQATGSSALMWPSSGKVIQSYSDSNGSDHALHLSGTIGDKIVASQDGLVIYSGVFNNYGNTVIISHNNGLLTLYACNSKNMVQSNQNVKKGETIALVGNTCASGKTLLYYQVRMNGKPVDPAKYLAKR